MKNHKVEKTYEERRQNLRSLVERLGHGGIAKIAKEIDVEANYISRCLYAPDKKGRKNIGDETVIKLDKAYPGWQRGAHILTEPSNILYGEFDQSLHETITIIQRLSQPRQQAVLRQAKLLLLEQQQEDQNSIQAAG